MLIMFSRYRSEATILEKLREGTILNIIRDLLKENDVLPTRRIRSMKSVIRYKYKNTHFYK